MSLFRSAVPGRQLSPGEAAYRRAMAETGELIERMRKASASGDPIRGVMADLWFQRHNVPYVTTIFEANAEMSAAVSQNKPPG